MSRIGFVYIMHNDAMNGIYKVGFTLRAPHARAEELSASTGVPMDYSVVYYMEVYEPEQTERDIHEALDEYRINPAREFFRCKLEEILKVFRQKCDFMVEYSASEYLAELSLPGVICGKNKPLSFESSLHDPAYLQQLIESFNERFQVYPRGAL